MPNLLGYFMVYPYDFESKIGFDSLREILIENCLSPMGKKEVELISFSNEFKTIKKNLELVNEMVSILQSGCNPPIDNINEISPYLIQIKVQGTWIAPDALLKISNFLRAIREIHDFFINAEKQKNEAIKYPALVNEFDLLELFPDIIKEIDRIVNKFGAIKDTASPELFSLRKNTETTRNSMSSMMRRIISIASSDGSIDKDISPTMRDGRLVIPVDAANKRQIKGIIHDRSATGKTIFIEPAEIVEIGNKIRELEMECMREERKILIELADYIRPFITGIIRSEKIVGKYDFIRAKALFAISINAHMPIIEKRSEIDWYHAVHPMLLLTLRKHGKDVVPLNLQLNRQTHFLIISGPNAGGKSVTLKTVAIVQYMIQTGILPPLYSNSHVGIFDNIFIDIGDEQSIENDLSTYSSHLKNMKYFLKRATSKTLLLCDEMGSGTEPEIGGALAQAILAELSKSQCTGIVTTHYRNLKTFAKNEPGFINGAMLYDRQHLMPLFQLSVGDAGSSFAIEIASKIGLPTDVINSAKEIVGSDYINMDKYLLDIARDRHYWNSKRLNIREKERKLEQIEAQYENRIDELKKERNNILADARDSARKLLAESNARVERTIHEIKIAEAERERTKVVRKELEEYKKNIERENNIEEHKLLKSFNHKKEKHNRSKNTTHENKKENIFSIGDYVRMSDGGVVGKILGIQGNKAEVAFGALRTKIELSRLCTASKPKESTYTTILSANVSDDSRKRQLDFSTELDVRGMKVDEAIQAVTYFLDDAIQFSYSRVRILHGTGTGALRTALREMLNANTVVVSFHDEDVRFGGAGITIVNLS
jgi:DNA mismatch repair protein MutS2